MSSSSKLNCPIYSPLAQSVEQLAVNQWVAGSSPAGGAESENCHLLNS